LGEDLSVYVSDRKLDLKKKANGDKLVNSAISVRNYGVGAIRCI
jgi:hypothetical protein